MSDIWKPSDMDWQNMKELNEELSRAVNDWTAANPGHFYGMTPVRDARIEHWRRQIQLKLSGWLKAREVFDDL